MTNELIQVQVKFFNVLRDTAGQAGVVLSVPPDTSVRKLVTQVLVSQRPELAGILLDAAGNIAPYIRLFVNGTRILDGDLDEPLHAGDEVRIFPAIAGG